MLLDSTGTVKGLLPLASGPRGRKGLYYRLGAGESVEVVDVRAALDAPPPDPVHFDDLTSEEQGADLLIVAHSDFMDQAARLKKQHEDEGWTVRLVDVQCIFDTFSDGELSPPAIKAFLGYALRHWKRGAPGQVLLFGDCTSDYLNVTRNEVRNWVPTYTYNRGAESWASDYWFTTVAGDDNLGDLMIGRISVASEKDAEAVVTKTIEYVAHPKPGPWRARLAYVSDEGEFPDVVEELRRDYTPEAYSVWPRLTERTAAGRQLVSGARFGRAQEHESQPRGHARHPGYLPAGRIVPDLLRPRFAQYLEQRPDLVWRQFPQQRQPAPGRLRL